jgi:hypothetical protein
MMGICKTPNWLITPRQTMIRERKNITSVGGFNLMTITPETNLSLILYVFSASQRPVVSKNFGYANWSRPCVLCATAVKVGVP